MLKLGDDSVKSVEEFELPNLLQPVQLLTSYFTLMANLLLTKFSHFLPPYIPIWFIIHTFRHGSQYDTMYRKFGNFHCKNIFVVDGGCKN